MRALTAVALALGVVCATQVRADWTTPDGTRHIEVNSYPITYQKTGSGEPLVLVHGSLNDYRIWYAQVPKFAKKYRVITMSLRHYYPEKWDGKVMIFPSASTPTTLRP